MRKSIRGVYWLVGAYLIFTSMIYFLQERFIFLPTKLPQQHEYSFEYKYSEFNLNATDGAQLNALHFKISNPKGIILYFHGNAGNLSRWGEIAGALSREYQHDVVVMDYRTYGKSTGSLSEEALYQDGQLFYNHLLEHYPEKDIILYGRSLGTGIATRLAAHNDPGSLILETPYYSLLDIGQRRFPFLPVKWLLKYQFKSFEYVKDISCPVAIFHGTDDEVIPLDSGKMLFQHIPGDKKQFFLVEGGRHNNLSGFDAYHRGMTGLLLTD
jgi:pimeloyl-ACP methyl ester carboxylesterase